MEPTEEVVSPVERPFGVSASAIVAILGSMFVIGVGCIMATVPSMAPNTPNAPPISESAFRSFAIGMSIFLIAIGAFGIWTGLALFSLRPWARTSIMIFAGIMAVMCAISIVAVSMIPMPPAPDRKTADAMRFLRPTLIAMYGIPSLIAAWWLVQFNRPATKAAFASKGPLADPARPLSISIIAWMFLIGAPGSFVLVFVKLPLFIAGFVFTGVAAQIGYILYGLISLYLGRGLLKRNESARKLSIAYFALTGAHIVLVNTIPAWRTKMMSVQTTFASAASSTSAVESSQLLIFSLIFAVMFCGGGVWFLIRNKRTFS